MAKMHPDIAKTFIPIEETDKYFDLICPPEKAQQIFRDLYYDTLKLLQEKEAEKESEQREPIQRAGDNS